MAAQVVVTFARFRAETRNKSYLSGRWGTAWQTTLGGAWDAELRRTIWARRARWPDWAPSDALLYLGAERGLERVQLVGKPLGVQESEPAYRTRLRVAWAIWQIAGTTVGHQQALAWAGLTNTTVVRRRDQATIDNVAVSNYARAFTQSVWSQFDVNIGQPHPWSSVRWGGGIKWGDGTWTWGSTAQPYEVAQIRRLAQRFRSGHSTPAYAVVQIEPSPIWGAFTWGSTVHWGGVLLRWLIGEPHWAARGL